MKAVLGVGFEERSEAMDFGICLQGVRRVLGMDDAGGGGGGVRGKGKREGVDGSGGGGMGKTKDWGLKEGEMIRVEIGGKGAGLGGNHAERKKADEGVDGAGAALFSIKPPPPASGQHGGAGSVGGLPFLPPPPSAREVKEERSRSRGDGMAPEKGSAADLGFDDGEFGEFQ